MSCNFASLTLVLAVNKERSICLGDNSSMSKTFASKGKGSSKVCISSD